MNVRTTQVVLISARCRRASVFDRLLRRRWPDLALKPVSPLEACTTIPKSNHKAFRMPLKRNTARHSARYRRLDTVPTPRKKLRVRDVIA